MSIVLGFIAYVVILISAQVTFDFEIHRPTLWIAVVAMLVWDFIEQVIDG